MEHGFNKCRGEIVKDSQLRDECPQMPLARTGLYTARVMENRNCARGALKMPLANRGARSKKRA
eukprot:3380033-Lingulodinium_polyedra.AAC.1